VGSYGYRQKNNKEDQVEDISAGGGHTKQYKKKSFFYPILFIKNVFDSVEDPFCMQPVQKNKEAGCDAAGLKQVFQPGVNYLSSMKVKRVLFIVLGWLFIFLQLFNYVGSASRHEPLMKQTNIGYIIGYNFMLIFGIVFLFIAKRYKGKMQIKKEYGELNNLLASEHSEDGKPLS